MEVCAGWGGEGHGAFERGGWRPVTASSVVPRMCNSSVEKLCSERWEQVL